MVFILARYGQHFSLAGMLSKLTRLDQKEIQFLKAVFNWSFYGKTYFTCTNRHNSILWRQKFLIKNDLNCRTNNGQVKVHGNYTRAEASFCNQVPESKSRYDDVEEFLKKHEVKIKGNVCPPPFLNFEEAALPDYITNVLKKRNICQPTPVQCIALPIVLQNRDLIGISPTGSGKTLAYVIPAVIHLEKEKKLVHEETKSPYVLVLAPTRELVQQIHTVFQWFGGRSLNSLCAYGGTSRSLMINNIIRKDIDVCIATPGRCLDILRDGCMNLKKCSMVIIDEADIMLDMGFLPDVKSIIGHAPHEKQTLMWTATWEHEIEDVAKSILSNYIFFSLRSQTLSHSVNVQEEIEFCHNSLMKGRRLCEMLHEIGNDEKILIFVNTKNCANKLEMLLLRKRFRVRKIHGDVTQRQRDLTLSLFRSGKCRILVATDVAARGLDVHDVTYVINFDCPLTLKVYIHKIGRTARYGKSGKATTFVTPNDTHGHYLMSRFQNNEKVLKNLRSTFKKI